jgi:predicted RNase H-like HicB family nuclease
MTSEFTAVIKQDGTWWIGWIEEVPGVNCQEATREELMNSLTMTLREALDILPPLPGPAGLLPARSVR